MVLLFRCIPRTAFRNRCTSNAQESLRAECAKIPRTASSKRYKMQFLFDAECVNVYEVNSSRNKGFEMAKNVKNVSETQEFVNIQQTFDCKPNFIF